MSPIGWAVMENIALLAALCFLVWFTDSWWWALILLFMNSIKYNSAKEDT